MDTTLTLTAPPDQIQHADISVPAYHQRRMIWDRFAGALLLIVAIPVIVLLVLIVRITSKGAGIYKQVRVGKGSQKFSIYKIRTMYTDAEACGTPRWAVRKDARITPVGRVLRFLHLDELPQLINVARGEMGLIGPRPERPEFVAQLSKCVPRYMDRLAVLPGVTGLAQINLPADDSLESVRKKVVLDRKYIETGGLGLDLRIFFCTLVRMFGLGHGIAPKLFGIEHVFTNEPSAEGSEGEFVELARSLDKKEVTVPELLAIAAAACASSGCEDQDDGDASDPHVKTASKRGFAEVASSAPRRPR